VFERDGLYKFPILFIREHKTEPESFSNICLEHAYYILIIKWSKHLSIYLDVLTIKGCCSGIFYRPDRCPMPTSLAKSSEPWSCEGTVDKRGCSQIMFYLILVFEAFSSYLCYCVFQEDDKIVELVHKYGAKKWSVIAQSLPGRIGKQCRERSIFATLVTKHISSDYLSF
jgi:hypothetical protein